MKRYWKVSLSLITFIRTANNMNKQQQIDYWKAQATKQAQLITELRRYANHEKFNHDHGINRNDILFRIEEGQHYMIKELLEEFGEYNQMELSA